ncbi:cytochrome P450 protein [Rutstroemia sp. NJR-2017a BVV2]|nr:cytochrome P450 protein [Rutstroemia sp. NJR-2017a BVV2]
MSAKPQFSQALLQYPKDMVANMAAYQLSPKFLASSVDSRAFFSYPRECNTDHNYIRTVHAIITRNGSAMKTIIEQLEFSMGKGMNEWDEPEATKKFTIMQNMIELTEENKEYWTPDNLAQALLGIWFAASHQPWMNLDFVVLELCSHPEYIPLLREEIGDFSDLTYDSLEGFPILDSFIKETVRLNPLDTRAIRRKAMSPFRFTNGPSVPAGAMACVSSFDLMHEPESYPDPYTFNGQRFVSCTSEMRGTKFTDVSEKFPVWGYGSLAW